jgi:membrane-bound lytic murein transglycosylase D
MPGLEFQKARPRKLPLAIPIEKNQHVHAWINHFSGVSRDRFGRFMERGRFVKSQIQDILIQHGVPPEMYYLAMIESGFASHARSHASAVGVWQFTTGTAHRFGLRVDNYVDERLDLIKSTEAAARYLTWLHREFGDWYLSMAAYNAGENKIRRAIRFGRTRNYWKLAQMGLLPKETAQYVAKFQAAMTISRYPDRYRFASLTFYDFPKLQRMRGPMRYTDIDDLARLHKIPSETMRALNPQFIRGVIPPGSRYVYAPLIR